MGQIKIRLGTLLIDKGISKNKICKHCDMQRTQLNHYINNQMDRVDLAILARLCEYLDCEISDILEYEKQGAGNGFFFCAPELKPATQKSRAQYYPRLLCPVSRLSESQDLCGLAAIFLGTQGLCQSPFKLCPKLFTKCSQSFCRLLPPILHINCATENQ